MQTTTQRNSPRMTTTTTFETNRKSVWLVLAARAGEPDPASAMCAKLVTNMSHKQWREWVSPDIDYIKICPDLPIAPD